MSEDKVKEIKGEIKNADFRLRKEVPGTLFLIIIGISECAEL